jgi:uncharacterized protein YjbJ (UPF0337 family)
MENSTKQQLEGTMHETKGAAKEQIGKDTQNPELESEGRKEKVAGIVQKKLGEIEQLFGK